MLNKLALLAVAVCVSGAAEAAAGITYDCDTAAGHYSELVLPAPGDHFSVSGNIKVNTIAHDKKWAPTVRLRIASAPAAPGASPTAYGGFELTALPGKSVSMPVETVQAFSFDSAGRDSDMIGSSIKAAGAVQPFQLSFDGRSVAVAIAGETRSYPLTTNAPVVQVICSTGEFLITNLRLDATE